MGTVIAFAALILAAFVGSLLIAGGVNLRPSTTATPEQPVDLPKLTDAQWEWCQLHTGGPGSGPASSRRCGFDVRGAKIRAGDWLMCSVGGKSLQTTCGSTSLIEKPASAALAALRPVSSATPASSLDRSPSAGA